MLLATWNLNNRVGMVPFRPEAAHAAVALGADVLVITEYYPQTHHSQFCRVLSDSGWIHQLLSIDPEKGANRSPQNRANLVLIASRLEMRQDSLALPDFDRHATSNVVAAFFPVLNLRLIGLRVPAYVIPKDRALLAKSWEWLTNTAATLREIPAVITGDLNASLSSRKDNSSGGFRRILDNGWSRAEPGSGHSYFGRGGVQSEIDHILFTKHCSVHNVKYCTAIGGFNLADHPAAISDHAALIAELIVGAETQ